MLLRCLLLVVLRCLNHTITECYETDLNYLLSSIINAIATERVPRAALHITALDAEATQIVWLGTASSGLTAVVLTRFTPPVYSFVRIAPMLY